MKITMERLGKKFVDRNTGADNWVVREFSLVIPEKKCITLLGPSGCGKTTVLRMLAGLETPTEGRITAAGSVFFDSATGELVQPYRRNLGMVFQSYALWPHLSVAENIGYPLKLRAVPKGELQTKVTEAIRLVELTGLEKRMPHELSGGQQQRVALARAVVYRPAALLLDEPLSNLDAKLRIQMRKELRVLQRQLGLTMLYVTHDRTEAMELSDWIGVMERGKLLQLGTPEELVAKPASDFVATFLQ